MVREDTLVHTRFALWLAVLAISLESRAAEMAHSENFIVLAPDPSAAEEVLARAEQYRKEIAVEWLGQELPPSVGRTTINVEFVDGEDRALTWPAEGPSRKYHKMWLTSSRDRAAGSTLRHEIAHVVLHTRYPDMLPAWADEGIASLYDDPRRQETRRGILAWYAQTGNWPGLREVLQSKQIPADDQASYSVAASLAEYLLSRAGKHVLLAFAVAGNDRQDWDAALAQHYGISSVADLERQWRTWAAAGKTPAAVTAVQRRPRANNGPLDSGS